MASGSGTLEEAGTGAGAALSGDPPAVPRTRGTAVLRPLGTVLVQARTDMSPIWAVECGSDP